MTEPSFQANTLYSIHIQSGVWGGGLGVGGRGFGGGVVGVDGDGGGGWGVGGTTDRRIPFIKDQ